MTERKPSHAEFIAAVKPVCEAATEGPWTRHDDFVWDEKEPVLSAIWINYGKDRATSPARNAEFCALARAALPEALERLDAAVADNERWASLAGDGLHGQRDLHARLLKAEAKRDELQKLRQIAQNWQENERAIVEHGPSEGRGRWKMETELALSLALDRLAAQEETP